MNRLLILILGTLGIFMLFPDVSAEAKLRSSGQGIQAGRVPSDGAQRPSQSRSGRSAGTAGRQRIPAPDKKPVHEPDGSGGKRKPGIRRKPRKSRKSQSGMRKKHRKLRAARKRLRKDLKNMKSVSVSEHFSSLTDKRMKNRIRHNLSDIIVITICAVISGADGWSEVETYGKSKYEWLKSFLELPNGIPSHDTFGRVFAMISPEEFGSCFLNWIRSVFDVTKGQVLPVDGKTLRRSYDKASEKAAVRMVSAWASEVTDGLRSDGIGRFPRLTGSAERKTGKG